MTDAVADLIRATPWWLFWPWLALVNLLAWWRVADSLREIRQARSGRRAGRGTKP